MRVKKLPRYLYLGLFTGGASLILGLLSFGGMFALTPILPLAVVAFILSAGYEGEIYLQNIKGTFDKLFKFNYLNIRFAKDYLREHFPNDDELNEAECPEFFRDYQKKLKHLHRINYLEDKGGLRHRHLDDAGMKEKKRLEKEIRQMEKWFTRQLFDENAVADDSYQGKLQQWFSKQPKEYQKSTWIQRAKSRRRLFHALKAFSFLTALFMSMGTMYLLVDVFSVTSLMTLLPAVAIPWLIVPMALVAGFAYGLLTYNAITDMIQNETLQSWYGKIRDDLKQGITLKSVSMAISAVLLGGLAVVLTIFTAGTWWTIAKEAKPIFAWMAKIPGFIRWVLHPLVVAVSALAFNLENTSESLALIEDRVFNTKWTEFKASVRKGWEKFREQIQRENWVQLLNPFRFILKVMIFPLRVLLFIGHLISIGVTADRVPGIPEIVSAFFGFLTEGFEDMHYFFGHDHPVPDRNATNELLEARLGAEAGHDHSHDLPTRFIKLMFLPVYILAAAWEYLASRLPGSEKALDWQDAWRKQTGKPKKESVVVRLQEDEKTSGDWKKERVLYQLTRQEEKVSSNNKKAALGKLKTNLRDAKDLAEISDQLKTAKDEEVYAKHRFFSSGQTETQRVLESAASQVLG